MQIKTEDRSRWWRTLKIMVGRKTICFTNNFWSILSLMGCLLQWWNCSGSCSPSSHICSRVYVLCIYFVCVCVFVSTFAGQRYKGRMKILSYSDTHKDLQFINRRIQFILPALHLKLIKCVELQGGCIRDSRPCLD